MPDSLPSWSLADLYGGHDDAGLASDKASCLERAKALAKKWKGRLGKATGEELAGVIVEYQSVSETLGRLTSYADLSFAADMSEVEISRMAQSMRELASEVGAVLVFIELEIASIDDKRMAELMKVRELAEWAPWLRLVRSWRKHQLSDELEALLIESRPAGRSAWERLFDETAAGLRFPIDGKEVTEAEVLDMMTDPDPEQRRKAGLVRSAVLTENERLMALVLNTIAKDKAVEDKWRGFGRPVSSRNLANDVEDSVVDALAGAVTRRMPDLTHRYYALKAAWMGAGRINWWDRNAPLPGEDPREFTWDEARSTVLDAFGEFDPGMAEIADRFFESGWIDAPHRPGKASGAFSHPTVPSAHPYILLNYSGRVNDVMTLAHELGHGVHQILAAPKGHFMGTTPLTLAETASVFGEMLVFRRLLEGAADPIQRRALLAGKIEDMLNTVVRQIGFHNFETRFHDARREGELTPEAISDFWMETQADALGPAVETGESYRPIWGFIPHFVHTPFYVYAYAFGDCLVNALWQVYQSADGKEKRDFVASYTDLLQAGGTRRHDEALAPFGLDARDEGFWSLGLDMVAGMIDELEAELASDGIVERADGR